MGLADELRVEVRKIFRERWTVREGQKVPDVEDIKLGNDAVELDATVLYADLSASTAMVDSYHWQFAAEIYKAYLHCASKVIRAEQGTITAFDGDRVMAVFIGNAKNTSAARCALKIKAALAEIVNPLLKESYPKITFDVGHVVGVDTSTLHVARTGVWGTNDLVWVGSAANHAAKLSSLNRGYAYVTKAVYDAMNDDSKFSKGTNMWEARTWTAMNDETIYRSSWQWSV